MREVARSDGGNFVLANKPCANKSLVIDKANTRDAYLEVEFLIATVNA